MSDTSAGTDPIDTTKAHPARRYDFLLGGKDNYEADRESGRRLIKANPDVVVAAKQNRYFLRRVAGVLAAEHGIRQFLDIGTGIPTSPNLHEVVQRIDPAARVVYVDNDPVVMVHARALLTSTAKGRTAYVQADLRDPDHILADPALRDTLDLTQPVALTCIALLHFLPDDDAVVHSLRTLLDALPPGSMFALSHGSDEHMTPSKREAMKRELGDVGTHGATRSRTRHDLQQLIDELRLQLLEPGIVSIVDWRPDVQPVPGDATAEQALCWAAVARRPSPTPPGGGS